MASSTPGPWIAEQREDEDGWEIRQAGDGSYIATVPNPYEHLGDRPDLVEDAAKETEANARLVALAPEMADVLHDLTVALNAILAKPEDEGMRPHARHFLERARQVLARQAA